jgi:hypothetical protein
VRGVHPTTSPAGAPEAAFEQAEVVLAETLPGYESRPQQQALAAEIEKTFIDGSHLLGQAGCGLATPETIVPTSEGVLSLSQLLDLCEHEPIADLRVAGRFGSTGVDHVVAAGSHSAVQVVVASGHEATVAANQTFIVLDPDGVQRQVAAERLRTGQRVACCVGSETWGRRLDLNPFVPNVAPNAKQFSWPNEIDVDMATLLGVLVADGDCNGNRLRVSNARVVDLVVHLGGQVWGYERPTCRPLELGSVAIEFNGRALCQWAAHIGMTWPGPSKRVPLCVAQAPREIVVAFLDGLFLDSIVTSEGKWRFASASKPVADFVTAALFNLGVRCSRRAVFDLRPDSDTRKAGPSWQVWVETNADLFVFSRTFQIYKPGLRRRLEARRTAGPHSNVDLLTIPDLIEDLRVQNRWETRRVRNWTTGGHSTRWDSVQRLLDDSAPCEAADRLRVLMDQRRFWAKVIRVEPLTNQEMVGLAMLTRNGYVGNGLLTHV